MLKILKETYTVKEYDSNKLLLHKKPLSAILPLLWSIVILIFIFFFLLDFNGNNFRENLNNLSDLNFTDHIPLLFSIITLGYFLFSLIKVGRYLIYPNMILDKRKNSIEIHGKNNSDFTLSDVKEIRVREYSGNDTLYYKCSLVFQNGKRLWFSGEPEKEQTIELATIIADFVDKDLIFNTK